MVKVVKGAKVEKNALIDNGEDGARKSRDPNKRSSRIQDPDKRASDVQRSSGIRIKRASTAGKTGKTKRTTQQSKLETVNDLDQSAMQAEIVKETTMLEKNGNFAATSSVACFCSLLLTGAMMVPLLLALYLPLYQETLKVIEANKPEAMEEKEGSWNPCYFVEEENRECCNHAGACVQNAITGQRKCLCDDGTQSVYCRRKAEEIPEPCKNLVCLNGGTCKKLSDRHAYCLCPLGFLGLTCNSSVSPCNPNPCLNGGTCHDRKWTFACECQSDFAGRTCQRKAILCTRSRLQVPNCGTLGICTNLFGGRAFTCSHCVGEMELCSSEVVRMGPAKKCCPGGLSLVPGPPNIPMTTKQKDFRRGKDSPTAFPGTPDGCGYFCMPKEQAAFYLGSQQKNAASGTAVIGTAVNVPATNGTAANRTTAIGTAVNVPATNGTAATGTAVNGTAVNGTAVNGTATIGTAVNVPATNGTAASGTATNGTPVNVTATNGAAANGTAVNGTAVSGAAAP